MVKMRRSEFLAALAGTFVARPFSAADNQLTAKEKKEGWILLFDGKTYDGWMTSDQQPSKRPIEDNCINPHKCGAYMMVHRKEWENFILSTDFKISPHCNSGIFVRTSPLAGAPRKDVGWYGLEIAIDDTNGTGYHDTGAVYDLAKPTRQAMKPVGEWNHIIISCDRNIIAVNLNGEDVNRMDLDQFTKPYPAPTVPSTSSIIFSRIARERVISAYRTTAQIAGLRTSS